MYSCVRVCVFCVCVFPVLFLFVIGLWDIFRPSQINAAVLTIYVAALGQRRLMDIYCCCTCVYAATHPRATVGISGTHVGSERSIVERFPKR